MSSRGRGILEKVLGAGAVHTGNVVGRFVEGGGGTGCFSPVRWAAISRS